MNASLSAALLLLLLSGGWFLGRRRRRPFLRSTDTSAVVALNRAQIERLQPSSPLAPGQSAAGLTPASIPAPAGVVELPSLPLQARERRQWLRQLQGWMAGSREQRLMAMAMARQSSCRDVLPLLRLGLRDPDPEVMAAAAAAMDRFRGRPAADPQGRAAFSEGKAPAQPGREASLRPRRVLRTR